MKLIIYLIVILTVIFVLYKSNISLLSWWYNKISIQEEFSGKRNDKNDKKYKCSVKPNKEYGTYDAFTLTPAQKAKTQDAFPGKSPKFWACKQACKSRDRETGAPIKGECIPIGDGIMKDIVDITAPSGYTPHTDKTIKFLTSDNKGANDKTLKNQSSLDNAIKNAFPNREDFDTKVWALEWNEKLKIANFKTKKADGAIPGNIKGFSLQISPGWRSFVNTSKSGHGSQIITNYIGGWEESLARLWKGIKDVNYKSILTSDCKKACEDEEECLGYQTGYIKKDGKAECLLVNSWKNPGRDFKLRNGKPRDKILNSKSYIKVVDLYYKDIIRLNNEYMISDWRDPERTIYNGTNESGYRGYQTKTKSGKTCQSWQNHSILSKAPRRRMDAANMIDYGNDQKKSHNYCRNPVPNNDPKFGTLKLFNGNGACQKGGCNWKSCPSPYKCGSINRNQCSGSGDINKTYNGLRAGESRTLPYNNMYIRYVQNNKLYAKINGKTLSVHIRQSFRDTEKFPDVASSTTKVYTVLGGNRFNYCQDPRWESKQNEIWCYTSPNSLEKEKCLPKYEYSDQSKGEQEGYLAIRGNGTANGKPGFSLWTDKNPNRQGGNSQWQILSAIGKTGPVKHNDVVYLYNTNRDGYDGGYLSLRKDLGKNKCNNSGYTSSTLKLPKPDSSCKFKIQLKNAQNPENIKTNSKIILTSEENNSLTLITCNWIKWHLNRDIAITSKSGNNGKTFPRKGTVSYPRRGIKLSNQTPFKVSENIYVFGGRWAGRPGRKEMWLLVSVDANGKQTGLRYTYKIKNIPKNILTIEIWNSAKTLNVNPAWKKKNISVTNVILTKQPGNSESSKFWRITPVTSSGLRIGVNNAYKLENEVTDYVFTDTNVDCKNWTEGKIDKTAISSPGINTITKCGDKCNKNEKCKGFYFDPDSKECWMESGFCENTKGNKGHYIKTQVGWCGPEGSNVLSTSTFPKCKKECLDNKNCNAIRFVKETGKCNLLRSCATNNEDKNWRNIIFSVKSNTTGTGMAGMQRTKGYEVTNPDDKNIYNNNNNTDKYIKTDKNNIIQNTIEGMSNNKIQQTDNPNENILIAGAINQQQTQPINGPVLANGFIVQQGSGYCPNGCKFPQYDNAGCVDTILNNKAYRKCGWIKDGMNSHDCGQCGSILMPKNQYGYARTRPGLFDNISVEMAIKNSKKTNKGDYYNIGKKFMKQLSSIKDFELPNNISTDEFVSVGKLVHKHQTENSESSNQLITRFINGVLTASSISRNNQINNNSQVSRQSSSLGGIFDIDNTKLTGKGSYAFAEAEQELASNNRLGGSSDMYEKQISEKVRIQNGIPRDPKKRPNPYNSIWNMFGN